VIGVCDRVATVNEDWSSDEPDPGTSMSPYRLYNIGNNQPVQLMDYIHLIEDKIGKKADINFLPLQPGDVPKTYADIDDIERDVNYRPSTSIEKGIANFVDWYKDYYKVA